MQSPVSRRRIVGKSVIWLIAILSIGYVSAGVPWRAIGVVLIGIGVFVTLPALWSMRAPRFRDWGAEPATAQQVSGISRGLALFMLGMAFISMSIFDIRHEQWEVALMGAAATFVALYGAVSFLSVVSLVRRGH